MNATDAELDRSSDACERWTWRSGGLVVLGLIFEFIIACTHPEYDSFFDRWGSVLSDIFVAAGVAAEIIFGIMGHRRGAELQRRSNDRLAIAEIAAAEANERAAKSELELANLQIKLLPREVKKEQYDELQTLRGKVPVVIITSISDFEATRFAEQIAVSLIDAGIDVRKAQQRIGLVWTELYIVIPTLVPDFSKNLLYSTFKKAGFSVGCGDRGQISMSDLPMDIPVIMVGQKAPASLGRPPYVFTLPPKADDET